MKLILISSQETLDKEYEILTDLFKAGLPTLHLRKPRYSTKGLKRLLSRIPPEFHQRIVIHSHHKLAAQFNLKGIHLTKKHIRRKLRTWITLKWLKSKKPNLTVSASFNRLSSILDDSNKRIKLNYVFLSPIFSSTDSKYQAGFTEHSLKGTLIKSKYEIIARGGIDITTIKKVSDIGFSGMALHSVVWKSEDPVAVFKTILDKIKELNIAIE